MNTTCPHCQKEFAVPEGRIKMGERLSLDKIVISCPACNLNVDVLLKSNQKEVVQPPQKEATQPQSKAKITLPLAKKLPTGEVLKKKILQRIKDLPAMPQTVMKARQLMASEKSSIKELAAVLETDQAIAVRVLKMANSSYYGMSGKVSSIQHASVVLGINTLGQIITLAGSSAVLGGRLKGYGTSSGDLWRHSLAVAFASKLIALKKNPLIANDAFTAGLLHDVGKLILDEEIFERKDLFNNVMATGKQSFLKAEKEILGFDHAEIAAEVCKSWNVPESLAIAIQYHHSPADSQGDELTYIIHMADAIGMMTGLGMGEDGMLYNIDDKAMRFLGLTSFDMPMLIGETAESVEKMAQDI
ncbi:MAG: HDOD domain-containing protein [Pseudomonadota bacterium]